MKYLFYYKRYGLLRFLSNHETMRMIERILRRTGMSFKMTEGFHKRLKISFGQASPTGIIDKSGLFLLSGEDRIDYDFIKLMNSLSPWGFEVYKIEAVKDEFELGKYVKGYIFTLIFLEKPNISAEWKIDQRGKIWKTSFFVPFNAPSPKVGAFGQYLTIRDEVIFKENFEDESTRCR